MWIVWRLSMTICTMSKEVFWSALMATPVPSLILSARLVSEIYNESHKKKISFTPEQKYAFSKVGSFGVPLSQMGEFLDLASQQEGQTKMDQWLSGEDENPNHVTGIPISWNSDEAKPNEFQMWMKAMRQTENSNLADKIKDGTGVAIKADQNTSFDIVLSSSAIFIFSLLQLDEVSLFIVSQTLPSGLRSTCTKFVSCTFSVDTEGGVITVVGSF